MKFQEKRVGEAPIMVPGYEVCQELLRGDWFVLYRGRCRKDGSSVLLKTPHSDPASPFAVHLLEHEYAFLYSLGVTFYKLLTGRPPFRSADRLEMIHQHIARTPRSPTDLDPQIPEPLSLIVMRPLDKTAEERYQSALGSDRGTPRRIPPQGSWQGLGVHRGRYRGARNAPMLRISLLEGLDQAVTIRVEGQVRGPWVDELRRSCEQLLAQGDTVCLDLSDASFIDLEGVALRRRLRDRKVGILRCSPFVAEQLKCQMRRVEGVR